MILTLVFNKLSCGEHRTSCFVFIFVYFSMKELQIHDAHSANTCVDI